MSKIVPTGHATLRSATTAEAFEVEAADLRWTVCDRGGKRVGDEAHHVAIVERKASDGTIVACRWTVAEYRPGNLVHTGHHCVGGLLTQNFRFALKPLWCK